MNCENPESARPLRGPLRRLRSVAAALSLALVACGESKSSDDGGGAGSGNEIDETALDCPKANDIIDPSALIDDFEDEDGKILPTSGRNGGWWTAGDQTLGGTIVPERADVSLMEATPEAIDGDRCGSRFAMRVTGQGFNDWGALLGVSLAYGERPNGEDGGVAYDASGRQGVDFWARIGDTSTNQVRFAVSDSNTEPDGGLCVEDGAIGEECFDTFGVYLTQLDTRWRHYRVPFIGLAQREFGLPADGVALASLYTIQFNFDPGAIFDLWVDDVAFY